MCLENTEITDEALCQLAMVFPPDVSKKQEHELNNLSTVQHKQNIQWNGS